ncbi:MAG: helix-turn-helix domain-containing protein [Patescibacteria group bacterium]
MKHTISLLEQLGCSIHEARTFLALCEAREGASVVQLARKMNIPRPSVYGYLSGLIAKGLVKKSRGNEGARFHAESPEYVGSLFAEKAHEMNTARPHIIHELSNLTDMHVHEPKFFFYDGADAADRVFRDVVRSGEKNIFWFVPIRDTLKVISFEVMQRFHRERIARNMKIQVLWPLNQKVRIRDYPQLLDEDPRKSLREVRILPAHMDMWLGYGIYGTRVAFNASQRENYGFIVDSVDLSRTLKKQFDYWWRISKPLESKK